MTSGLDTALKRAAEITQEMIDEDNKKRQDNLRHVHIQMVEECQRLIAANNKEREWLDEENIRLFEQIAKREQTIKELENGKDD